MRSKAVVPDFSAPGSRSKEDTFSKDMGVGSGFRMIHTCIAFTLPISSMTVTSAPPQIRHSIPEFGDPNLEPEHVSLSFEQTTKVSFASVGSEDTSRRTFPGDRIWRASNTCLY